MTAHLAGVPIEETLLPLMSMSILVSARVVVSANRRRRRGRRPSISGRS